MKRAKTGPNDRAKGASAERRDLRQMELDRRGGAPLYRQLYERIAQSIKDGTLRPGERLPSARSLAAQLATSRGTVDLAYSLLSSDGYVLTLGAAGTVVARAPAEPRKGRPALQRARGQLTVESDAEVIPPVPFAMGLPAFDAFPRKLWSRLTIRRARSLPLHQLNAPPAGYPPLREAIRSYLAVSRGISCSTEQLFVTSGFQSAVGLITRAFFQSGVRIWMEDPGYFMARLAFKEAGAKLVAVPVDTEGLNVDAAIAQSPDAGFAFVTPSHQMPLGVSLSQSRRLALLSWAANAETWVIEDDYDSEFRYGSRPLPALKSLDQGDRVFYVGTFSKVLFPGLRLGYIVVPLSTASRVEQICRLFYRDRPIFDQAVVADFITEGHFARHIRRMRQLYAARRAALAGALAKVFDGQVNIELQAGGMHLLARFSGGESDTQLVERANAAKLWPAALSPWSVEHACGQGLLLNFTNIPEEKAVEMAHRLRQALLTKIM